MPETVSGYGIRGLARLIRGGSLTRDELSKAARLTPEQLEIRLAHMIREGFLTREHQGCGGCSHCSVTCPENGVTVTMLRLTGKGLRLAGARSCDTSLAGRTRG